MWWGFRPISLMSRWYSSFRRGRLSQTVWAGASFNFTSTSHLIVFGEFSRRDL